MRSTALGFLTIMSWANSFIFDVRRSIPIAINRSTGPIGTNLILILVGHYNARSLAELTLLLALASIFCAISTSGQIGLQVEFARLCPVRVSENFRELLGAALLTYGGIGVASSIALVAFAISATSPHAADIAYSTYAAVPIFSLSLPFLTSTAVFTMAMEAANHASLAARIRLIQMGWLICAILIVTVGNGDIKDIAWAYVSSDMFGLAMFVYLSKRREITPNFRIKRGDFSLITLPFKTGGPLILGQIAQKYSVYVLTSGIAIFGAASTNALTTINMILFFSQIIVIGISQAASIEVAKRIEEGLPVQKIIREKFLNLTIMSFGISSLIFLGRENFKNILTTDLDSASIFIDSLPFVIAFFIASNFVIYAMSLLRSFRDYSKPQIIISIFMAIIFAAYLNKDTASNFFDVFRPYVALSWITALAIFLRLAYIAKIYTKKIA